METESQYAGDGMGRQMGFDGPRSKLEAGINHPQLWRPDCFLADWHRAELGFWRFEHEKAYGCLMGGRLYICSLHRSAHS